MITKNQSIPHFIIVGAMKSGTTTLHYMLDQHPDISIPAQEVHFFDADNILQHPDFNTFNNTTKKWVKAEVNSVSQLLYKQQFSDRKGQLIGEDSTTYFASESAFKRIAEVNSKTKIIVMLRQPSSRAYSNYWHLLQTGRATASFEDTLVYNPYSIMFRSLYLQQLTAMYKYIPKENVKIVIFEDFLLNKQAITKDVCDFLKVDFNKLPEAVFTLHNNKTQYPKYIKMQYLFNRFFPKAATGRYKNHFTKNQSNIAALENGSLLSNKSNITEFLLKVIRKTHRLLNPLVEKPSPKINSATKELLDDYFKKELEGIESYIGEETVQKWFRS